MAGRDGLKWRRLSLSHTGARTIWIGHFDTCSGSRASSRRRKTNKRRVAFACLQFGTAPSSHANRLSATTNSTCGRKKCSCNSLPAFGANLQRVARLAAAAAAAQGGRDNFASAAREKEFSKNFHRSARRGEQTDGQVCGRRAQLIIPRALPSQPNTQPSADSLPVFLGQHKRLSVWLGDTCREPFVWPPT